MSDNSAENGTEKHDAAHLNGLFEAVCDKSTFLSFVSALGNEFADDRAKRERDPPWASDYGPNGWAHGSIDAFLSAVVACADGKIDRYSEEASWKNFAAILYGGKFYE